MRDEPGAQGADRDRILRLLENPPQAAFVSSLSARTRLSRPHIDAVLTQLVAANRVVVVENASADPHLEDMDTRVVAVIADGNPGVALQRAHAVWDRWLADFLGSHRCS